MQRTLMLLLALVIVVAGGCQKKVDLAASRAALRTADAEWSKATTSADAFAGFMAPEGVVYPPNEPAVVGSGNVRAWAERMMAMPGFTVRWQATSADVAASGDLGYTTGTYELSMQGPDGTSISDNGKYMTVWKKDAQGNWKVLYDMFNSAVPLSSATPADTMSGDDMMYDTMNDK